MEKYLVPIDKVRSMKICQPKEKRYQQLKIQNLKGVVNVDEILRIKSLLKVPSQSPEVISKCLNILSEKVPSVEILKSTKIARVVLNITKHLDSSLADKARIIVDSWTSFHTKKLSSQKIDVMCDYETNAARQNYKNSIKWVLSDNNDDHSVDAMAEAIEREVFLRHKLIRKTYSLVIRKIISQLEKNEDDLKHQVLQGRMSCCELVRRFDDCKNT